MYKLIRTAACIATLGLAMLGCRNSYDTFEANPDRNLSGLASVPLLPDDLVTLRRIAVLRTAWSIPLPAEEASRLVIEGARTCHKRSTRSENLFGGALGELARGSAEWIVDVEEWPKLNATVIGLGVVSRNGFGAVMDRGYFVMYAIQANGSGSIVYAYQREETKLQRELVSLAPIWLSGQPTVCEVGGH